MLVRACTSEDGTALSKRSKGMRLFRTGFLCGSSVLEEMGFTPCHYGISQRYVACMEVIARNTRRDITPI